MEIEYAKGLLRLSSLGERKSAANANGAVRTKLEKNIRIVNARVY
jgi:hypothetical protein